MKNPSEKICQEECFSKLRHRLNKSEGFCTSSKSVTFTEFTNAIENPILFILCTPFISPKPPELYVLFFVMCLLRGQSYFGIFKTKKIIFLNTKA